MKILDEKFVQQPLKYVTQCALAILCLIAILLFLDIETNAVTIAALGSSSFVVFAMPTTTSAQPRFLIGSYVIAILTGSLFHFIAHYKPMTDYLPSADFILPVCAASSVGLAIFLMVIFNFEHPPAGGLALGLVVNDYSGYALIVVLLGITMLAILKYVLKPILIDLI
jgi:CBS-domain-containing membrane protein